MKKKDKNIEGNISEFECACALRGMNNIKCPGSDGITTASFKIFWNDLKSFHVKSLNYSFENGSSSNLQNLHYIFIAQKEK